MPEPLIILCPARSFSSIVSAIIGQHPDCYGLPELNLFLGDTLGEAWHAYPTMRFVGRDGLLRVLSQLHDGEQTNRATRDARKWIDQHSDWPIRKVFDHIQELVGDKVLIEKSPSTTIKREYMERIFNIFPNTNILHLVRHPRGTGESLITLRADFGVSDLPALRDPEDAWRTTHELIMNLTEELPLGQCMRLKGESLLANLDTYLPQICEWLGISTAADAVGAMMHPEESPYAKPGPRTAPRGNDPNFLANPVLDHARLAKLKEPRLDGELKWRPGEMFEPETRKLAKQLGYQ